MHNKPLSDSVHTSHHHHLVTTTLCYSTLPKMVALFRPNLSQPRLSLTKIYSKGVLTESAICIMQH